MGGTIGVNSELGHGSSFWFTTRLGIQPTRPSPNPMTANKLEGVRICLIDDNATNRMLLHEYTNHWGMQSLEAEDGHQALALLRESAARGESYDIAVVDMFMPGMNGLDLAKVIKADPQLASIRLILLNPLGNRVDAETARRAGLASHLTKPVRHHQLHQCLLNVMSRSQTIHPTSPHQEPEQKPKGPALRLLLAEDNVVNQKVAIRMLETLGYQVDVAANGREAVKAVTQTPYAGILMDCQMPEMDGFEATVAIRKQEGSSSVPIIAMTANAMQNDRENCLAVGMNAFLSKPVKLQDLKSILEKWIPRNSGTDQNQRTTEVANAETLTTIPEPVSSGPSSLPPLDPTTLADLRQLGGENDPGFVATVVEQFLQDSEIHVAGIQHAIEENNGDSLRKVAHALKGCSRIIGAHPLSEIAFQLEEMGQTQDLAEAEDVFKVLRSEFERVQAALQAELSPTSPAIS